MKIVNQSWSWVKKPNGDELLRLIEEAGRTCYKSEDKITLMSHHKFAEKMLKSGHHAMIEHAQIPPVRVITDRGVTHEIVRHRLFSFAQESTRYCNYSKDKFGNEITYITPVGMDLTENDLDHLRAMQGYYLQKLDEGLSPQQARYYLPNALKTEIIITGNLREWRHFFTLRCSPKAHPQMQAIAIDMLNGFVEAIPILFDDIQAIVEAK